MIYHHELWTSQSLSAFFTALAVFVSNPVSAADSDLALVQQEIDDSSFTDLILTPRYLQPGDDLDEVAESLWEKYVTTAKSDAERLAEHQGRALSFGDKSMRFSFDKLGERPRDGYPLYIALHGGGTAPSTLNDRQWNHMKVYYKDSVETGIYVATRGVTNTWNLHFVDESYPLYDRLIENMIAYEGVDPNRVYLLGFSAGGDGVYQITPRMADRWAGANMSAGHHNWISFDNLYNTPFLMQMGENDRAYQRNRVAAENYVKLQDLQNRHGGYVHDLFLHAGGSHNSWSDNDATGSLQPIIANPKAWLERSDRSTIKVNTNAVHWLNAYKRNSLPEKIIWDSNTNAPRPLSYGARYVEDGDGIDQLGQPKELFYWLDLSVSEHQPENGRIVASIDRQSNSFEISEIYDVSKLRLLVHGDMLDLSRPISVSIRGRELGQVTVIPNLAVMSRTLLERGDPSYTFHGEITLAAGQDGEWHIVQ